MKRDIDLRRGKIPAGSAVVRIAGRDLGDGDPIDMSGAVNIGFPEVEPDDVQAPLQAALDVFAPV